MAKNEFSTISTKVFNTFNNRLLKTHKILVK
jgi:hypothetical protein